MIKNDQTFIKGGHMKKNFYQTKTYQRTIEKLKKILSSLDDEIYHENRLKSYLEIGKMISQSRGTISSDQKKGHITRLAKDSGYSRTQLYNFYQFFQRFPKGLPKAFHTPHIKWSHIREILPIEKTEEALFYLEQVNEDGLSGEDIHRAIKGNLFHIMQNQSLRDQILQRPTSNIFVFPARLILSLDGDTPDLMVDQGFDTWRKIRVRLRGINTPELHGPNHELALKGKDFLQETLGPLERFLVKTYKTDSFGRFIGDILYHPVWTDLDKIFREGIYLNAQLIQMGLAKPMFF